MPAAKAQVATVRCGRMRVAIAKPAPAAAAAKGSAALKFTMSVQLSAQVYAGVICAVPISARVRSLDFSQGLLGLGRQFRIELQADRPLQRFLGGCAIVDAELGHAQIVGEFGVVFVSICTLA